MSSGPIVTICIVHYRRLNLLKKAVDAIREGTSVPYKLKILNNGYEGDGIREYLETIDKEENIEIIFHPENIGCSPGRNVLTREISTPFIMMLDDDMYVSKGWDGPVFEMFEKRPDVGAIGFSIYNSDGTYWVGGRNLHIQGKVVNESRPKIDPKTNTEKFIEIDDVAAGAMVYRKELEDVITWDAGYFIGFEDFEKSLRVTQSKWKCLVSLDSHFIHDKTSDKKDKEHEEYNRSRRDYHAYRRSYLHFVKRNHHRMDMKRHIFYKYICLLPNRLLQEIVYLQLKLKKRKHAN